MEISEISSSVVKALTALQSMQKMTALNIANANTGVNQKFVFDMDTVLKNVQQTPTASMNSTSAVLSASTNLEKSDAIALDQEVMTSQQISGKYKRIVEGYNKQLALYQLAMGKGR